MGYFVWSEWHTDDRKAALSGAWMFAYGTTQWGIDLARQGDGYVILRDDPPYETIAGPFKTLEAAKAAYLLIGDLKNDNP